MGTFALASFRACGVQHDVVFTGKVPQLDLQRVCRDLKKICEAQIKLFEPRSARAPMLDSNRRYVFMTMVTTDGYGGLEHRASTALMCARNEELCGLAEPLRDGNEVAFFPTVTGG